MPTATVIMDGVRSNLNDAGGQLYTDAALLPHLRTAWGILQNRMRSAGIPTVVDAGAVLTIPANVVLINNSTTPALPSDLLNIQEIHEKGVGETDDFYQLMNDENVLPIVTPGSALGYYSWVDGELALVGATVNRIIRIRYLKSLSAITSGSVNISQVGAQPYLELKTAALASILIGQNRTRGDYLNAEAGPALEQYINTEVKGTQGDPVTRLPYGFRRRKAKWQTL